MDTIDTLTSAKKQLRPGTDGWTVSDLDDPELSTAFEVGRFEIVSGILKEMPPAYFDHGSVVIDLLVAARAAGRRVGRRSRISTEVDFILSEDDLLRVDGMLLDIDNVNLQKQVLVQLGADARRLGRIRVAPLLVIESVSPGHARHDRVTKRRLFAGFGVPNYWIVDAVEESLDCLVLDGSDYRSDAAGTGREIIRPSLFGGFDLALEQLWDEMLGDDAG